MTWSPHVDKDSHALIVQVMYNLQKCSVLMDQRQGWYLHSSETWRQQAQEIYERYDTDQMSGCQKWTEEKP